jgi:hypothetical protein
VEDNMHYKPGTVLYYVNGFGLAYPKKALYVARSAGKSGMVSVVMNNELHEDCPLQEMVCYSKDLKEFYKDWKRLFFDKAKIAIEDPLSNCEASAYLYCIEYYDDMPSFSIFEKIRHKAIFHKKMPKELQEICL